MEKILHRITVLLLGNQLDRMIQILNDEMEGETECGNH